MQVREFVERVALLPFTECYFFAGLVCACVAGISVIEVFFGDCGKSLSKLVRIDFSVVCQVAGWARVIGALAMADNDSL